MSSSDSSEDENLSKFKEAAVSVADLETSKKKEESKKASLRSNDDTEKFEGNFVEVTPEFQKFVAKKLSELIDE